MTIFATDYFRSQSGKDLLGPALMASIIPLLSIIQWFAEIPIVVGLLLGSLVKCFAAIPKRCHTKHLKEWCAASTMTLLSFSILRFEFRFGVFGTLVLLSFIGLEIYWTVEQ